MDPGAVELKYSGLAAAARLLPRRRCRQFVAAIVVRVIRVTLGPRPDRLVPGVWSSSSFHRSWFTTASCRQSRQPFRFQLAIQVVIPFLTYRNRSPFPLRRAPATRSGLRSRL